MLRRPKRGPAPRPGGVPSGEEPCPRRFPSLPWTRPRPGGNQPFSGAETCSWVMVMAGGRAFRPMWPGLQTTGFAASPEAETSGSELWPVAVPWWQACSTPADPFCWPCRGGCVPSRLQSAPPLFPAASRGSRKTVTVTWLSGHDSTSCAHHSLVHRPTRPCWACVCDL